MKELNINTGLVEYKLAEGCTVLINPTDSEFAGKLLSTYDVLEAKQTEYTEVLKTEKDSRVVFEKARQINHEIREVINDLFGKDICTPICGTMSIYALADGMPIWANILLVFIDEMTDVLDDEQKKSKARISKYTKKYHK